MKKVLVVDDSAFARKLVQDIINSSDSFTVAGTASNGKIAMARLHELCPDVITLDVEMPIMNGLETLAQIMKERPTPVVMLSSLTTGGASTSVTALQLGAVDVVGKPIAHGLPQMQLIAEDLLSKLETASQVDVSKLSRRSRVGTSVRRVVPRRVGMAMPVVVIATSTGGPRALRSLVPRLPAESGVFYVIVQHLPVGFTGPMARDLNEVTSMEVREAEAGDQPVPDTVLIAPAGRHCSFGRSGKIELTEEPPIWGVRPAADVTMCTAGAVFGSRVVGVVLTGMGRDGTNGLSMIRMHGGRTIAEHESSCIIYGMPKSAIEAGVVDKVATLDGITEVIARFVG